MTHYDVVIAGCGPVGAALGNLLAARGLSVCIAEKHREIYDKPRAITFDWEGMRVLQFCGVAEEFAKGIRPHPGTDFRGVDGQVIKLFDPLPPPWDLGWPPTFTFVQPEMERLLREALERREAVTLMLGRSVEAFRDTGDRVEVDILDPESGGTETVTGDFLVGCDGANSGVREALGLPLDDLGFDETWLVVDTLQQRETAIPAKGTQFCRPWRPATFIPGPGKLRRWELKVMPGESPAEFEDPARVRDVLADLVDVDAVEIWRSATYRFAARVGREWRKGRVILAGDAVHQTPPFLGQGLCSGIRDAANLAWKLVHIRRCGFNEALLDSYHDERRPHVVAVVEAAKEFGKIVGELDMDKARARDAKLMADLAAGRMETRRQKFIPNLETGILHFEPGVPREEQVAGTLMSQPEVYAPDGTKRLLDDLVPMEWLYVTTGFEAQSWMEGMEHKWRSIGGRRVVILPSNGALPSNEVSDAPFNHPPDIQLFHDSDGRFARWCETTGLSAALVRPDRYILASINNSASLAKMTVKLTQWV
ncbi:MAG: bifunctional 3-(3-hydroxy-phenyl)propionate/3-hydroxycinnamic acid hydroxylase [Rhodospirillaceae bacterium]|nr:bifunctional 3-(3-hydroxy-phenyl)propionate/3-hydroxycinnamic acid hydroxylase [Rhodospirillaceae bacterium]